MILNVRGGQDISILQNLVRGPVIVFVDIDADLAKSELVSKLLHRRHYHVCVFLLDDHALLRNRELVAFPKKIILLRLLREVVLIVLVKDAEVEVIICRGRS
jgi:acetoacetate decarboxylase